MTPKEARYQLAADIEAGMANPELIVTASPPENPPAPPAIVLAPRAQYLTQGTACDWEMRLTATVAVSRVSGVPGLDLVDDIVQQLIGVLATASVIVTTEGVQDIGITQESQGVEYTTGTVEITCHI